MSDEMCDEFHVLGEDVGMCDRCDDWMGREYQRLLAVESRAARRERRLRALAYGYKARVLTIEDSASAAERACIVAWLRRAAVTFVEKLPPEDAFHDVHTDLLRDAFLDAAKQLEEP